MSVTAVTAFVPIPGHPRSENTYRKLALPLLESGITLLSAEGEIDKCWLWQHLMSRPHGFTWSEADNPKKNSLAYHCVQAQKTEWLYVASLVDLVSEVFVWIDYGIFHVPGVTPEIIKNFVERAADEQTIAIPGCWEKPYKYDDLWPCWRFCGGVMVVPRRFIPYFASVMKEEYVNWLEQTRNISWEVNTLARVEEKHPELPIWWYRADHDASIFTAYKPAKDVVN